MYVHVHTCRYHVCHFYVYMYIVYMYMCLHVHVRVFNYALSNNYTIVYTLPPLSLFRHISMYMYKYNCIPVSLILKSLLDYLISLNLL